MIGHAKGTLSDIMIGDGLDDKATILLSKISKYFTDKERGDLIKPAIVKWRGIRIYCEEGTYDYSFRRQLKRHNFAFEQALKQYPEGIFVDVGAHIGWYSIYASKRGFSQIYAYEPEPQNHNSLTNSIKANDLEDRITVSKSLIGSTEGHATLYIDENSTGLHSEFKRETHNKEIKREKTTLNSDLKDVDKQIGLIKIDVNGTDHEILEGASEIIKKHQPLLLVEADEDHIFKTLKEHNYRIIQTWSVEGQTIHDILAVPESMITEL